MSEHSSPVDDGLEWSHGDGDYATIRGFRSWFVKQHRKRIGVRYKGDSERSENDIVRRLLRRFSTARLKELSELFFGTELWRGCRKQHTISMLLYLLNRGWPEDPIPGVTKPTDKSTT